MKNYLCPFQLSMALHQWNPILIIAHQLFTCFHSFIFYDLTSGMSSEPRTLEALFAITLIFSSLYRFSIRLKFKVWLGHFKLVILLLVKRNMLVKLKIALISKSDRDISNFGLNCKPVITYSNKLVVLCFQFCCIFCFFLSKWLPTCPLLMILIVLGQWKKKIPVTDVVFLCLAFGDSYWDHSDFCNVMGSLTILLKTLTINKE